MDKAVSLTKVFSALNQPVIGFNNSNLHVVFANPAAITALGFDPTGRDAKEFLALDIISEKSDNFVCGTTICGRNAKITALKEDEITLLYIDFVENDSPFFITRQMISSLRNSAMGIKMSADRCFSSFEAGEAPPQKHVSVLYHYYYSLLRTLTQIDSAEKLMRGDMLFSPVPTDLVTLCSELTHTVSVMCGERDISIGFETIENELIAVVDPSRIEQLILNLFANSLLHTSSGNRITLSLFRSGNRIVISLDDDGEGISQEELTGVFKLPENTKPEEIPESRNGLGLYISLGIAQLHNGVLLIESREGKGTRVRVMLPTDEDPAPKFNSPESSYALNNASAVLSGLSDVLSSSSYGPKYED